MNFNSVLIGSEDSEALIAYYTRLFGKPDFLESGYAGWQLGAGSLSIGPHSEVHGRSVHPGRILLNIESDDVQGDFDRLKAAGAIVIREPYSMEGWPADTKVATLADPDDNYFQLQTPFEMGNDGA